MIAVHGSEKDFGDQDGPKFITAKVGFIVLHA